MKERKNIAITIPPQFHFSLALFDFYIFSLFLLRMMMMMMMDKHTTHHELNEKTCSTLKRYLFDFNGAQNSAAAKRRKTISSQLSVASCGTRRLNTPTTTTTTEKKLELSLIGKFLITFRCKFIIERQNVHIFHWFVCGFV